MPTVWLGRLQGYRDMRRVYGPDYMLAIVQVVSPSQSIGTFCMEEGPASPSD